MSLFLAFFIYFNCSPKLIPLKNTCSGFWPLLSLITPDINECRQRVCRSDQQCKNTRGGYTCIDLCPNGMTKGANGTCVGEYSPTYGISCWAREHSLKYRLGEILVLHHDWLLRPLCACCRHRWVQRWHSSMQIQSDLWEHQRQLPLHLSTWLQIPGSGTALCRYVNPLCLSYPVNSSSGKT